MAYIYGRPGHHTTAGAHRRDILLRIALPLLFLLALASAGLHAFLHGSYVITAFFVVFFVFLLLRFEELGLTLTLRLSGTDTKARADQIVAMTLGLLPEGYHVFHGLNFAGTHVDHAVLGPSGFFLISTRTNLGTITESRESLRLNGWPFLGDPIGQSWRHAKALLRHLDLQHSGAVQICPVLCFSRADVNTERIVRGVMITQASTLVRMLIDHESPLSSDRILELADKLTRLTDAPAGQAEITHLGGSADAGEEAFANRTLRPACNKCHHTPSDLEADLFPGECPRCGRLYSAPQEDDPSAPVPSVMRTPVAPLVTACLIVACGAGLLAYQAGLFDQMETTSIATSRTAADAGPQGSPGRVPSPDEQPVRPDAAEPRSDQAAPGQTDSTPRAQAEGKTDEKTKTADVDPPSSPEVDSRQSQAAPAAKTPDDSQAAPEAQSLACQETGGLQAPAASDTTNATAPPAQAKTTPPGPKSPAGLATEGTLTVVTARPAVMWLTNDQTLKRFGPYHTTPRKELDITLPKGFYTLVLEENGRRRQTTVSFLADTGRLEL